MTFLSAAACLLASAEEARGPSSLGTVTLKTGSSRATLDSSVVPEAPTEVSISATFSQ